MGKRFLVGGFDEDLHVGNSIIDMYIKCGFLECGRKVFDEMLIGMWFFGWSWFLLMRRVGTWRVQESCLIDF